MKIQMKNIDKFSLLLSTHKKQLHLLLPCFAKGMKCLWIFNSTFIFKSDLKN